MFYESKFGRKKETEKPEVLSHSTNSNDYSNSTTHLNGSRKMAPDLAVFEQFEIQVFSCYLSCLCCVVNCMEHFISFPSMILEINHFKCAVLIFFCFVF